MEKTAYFFCMTVCQHRTGAPLGKRCGVVFAGSVQEAEGIAWDRYGGDNACRLWAEQVPDDGFDFTVYKSGI